MKSATLPLHSRKDKEKRSLGVPTSPKKLVAAVLLIFIMFYTFKSANTNNDTKATSSTTDTIDYNVNPLFWAPTMADRTGKSAFPKSYFTTEALRENELNPVSAILLRVTDDDESIIYTVKHLLKYHFITDISIHNLVKNRPLTVENLRLDAKVLDGIHIEIQESDEELQSMARFTTCATAARLYCYFQDDTYLNAYMDSLYTNFLRFPTLIHANSKPSHYQNEMNWRFYNKDLKLHTGYADFRYGAFVPRWKVQNFLTQLGKSGQSKDNIRQAEHYFSIWMNQFPWLLSNPPHTANGVKATDLDIAYPEMLDTYTYDAIRHLQRTLTADTSSSPQDYFERESEPPVLQHRDVRSSCSNDRCLFMTNMDPFVRPEQIPFDYQNITSIPRLENAYNALSNVPPTFEWDEHSYHRVVDNDPNTCWNTITGPKKGDYFGLMLVGATRTDKITILTPTANEIKRPEKQLSVSVLTSESQWIQCKSTLLPPATTTGRISLGLNCGNVKYFRAIKVTFTKSLQIPFEICGLSLDHLSV